jgi:tetratricopeptide (TPR) repeat protein
MLAELQRKYDLAIKNYENNLSFWRDIGTFTYVAGTLNDLGRIAYYQGRYSEAEQYYSEAAKLARANNSEERNVSYLNNLGRVNLEIGQQKKVQEFFEQSLKLAQSNGLISSASDAQYGLAHVFEKDGRLDLALPLAQDTLKIYTRLHHKALVEVREFVESLEQKLKEAGKK